MNPAERPVDVSFSRDQSRVMLQIFGGTGNVLTVEMCARLKEALADIAQSPRVKLITLHGAGPDFSFGASVAEHAAAEIDRALPVMHQLIEVLLDAHAVTAAVVRGRCLGGGFELALACDFIFAADDAMLGLPEIALGVFPPAACALLPCKIGAARALRAILTGEARPATEWRDGGLVVFVVSGDALEAEVDRWFDLHLSGRSAATLRHAVAAARLGFSSHVRQVLPQLERLYLKDLMKTADAAEGIAAFMEKRTPRWTDR
jgi:cyclohexa-1,5-dienecarbonyl-CoA hydratase